MNTGSRKIVLTFSGIFALAIGCALPCAADLARPPSFRTQDFTTFSIDSPLWQNSRLAPVNSPFDRTTSINKLVQQNPLLIRLQSWRTTAPTNDLAAQTLQLAANSKYLQFGQQPLPVSELANLGGTTSAVSFNLGGRISFGSSAAMTTLNDALTGYDSTGSNPNSPYEPPQARDESRITWFSIRPVETKSGSVNLIYVRGRRDLKATQLDNKTFAQSTIWGGRGEFSLSSQWKVRGEWMNAKADEQSDSARAWKLVAGGPVKNPLGVLRIDANYSLIEPGFAPHTVAQPPSVGFRGGDLTMSQDLKIGDLTGNARLAFNQTQRPVAAPSSSTPSTSIPLQSLNTTNATAHLRWQVCSNIAIQSDHRINNVAQEMLRTADGNRDPRRYEQSAHDIGLEMKLSPSLAVTASTGISTNNDYIFRTDANSFMPSTLRNDRHSAIGITRRTKKGSIGLQFNRKKYAETVQNTSGNVRKEFSNVQIDAERQVCKWLRLKGSMRLAGEDDAMRQLWSDDSQQSIEAQFSFNQLGNLALRYSDWARRHYALDGQGTLPAAGATREYGIRYQVGANGNEAGLGLILEYVARDDRNGEDSNNLKVGLTYK